MRSRPVQDPSDLLGGGTGRSFAMLSTFPPEACGIATFSAALAAGLLATGAAVDVVRVGAVPDLEDSLVLAALRDGDPVDLAAAATVLNRADVAIVQHEYGIYDGPDGQDVLALMARLRVPALVVAHTVLASPTPHQRLVLQQVCAAAAAVVVMTDTAHTRLVSSFGVAPEKVTTIAHGAATPLTDSPPARGERCAPRLLTWGLLGPGKGIEWAIDALAELRDLRPRPTYLVAGATHPKVAASDGEAYREMLIGRTWSTGTAPWVDFDGTYRDLPALTQLIASADLVVLPYDSRDQVTSGVLVDAVAAGKPVVSTAFPHAVELLASGAGLVVPQRDPGALATAIRAVLEDPELAAGMAAEARRLAPALSWGAVAARYGELADQLVEAGDVVRT